MALPPRVTRLLRIFQRKEAADRRIPSDTQGSYTGTPADPHERPEQDADDL